jgi:hypothetical protein
VSIPTSARVVAFARLAIIALILVSVAATSAEASPTIQVPSTFCPGSTGVATLSPPDGGGSWANVQWSITNGTIVSSQGTTVTFRNYWFASITLGASATDTNGGTFTADPVTVIVHEVTPSRPRYVGFGLHRRQWHGGRSQRLVVPLADHLGGDERRHYRKSR